MRTKLVSRLPAWLGQELNIWRLLTLALLLAALSSVALGLTSVVRGLEAGWLLPLALLGGLTGWALALSPWPGWLAGLLAFSAGLGAILLRFGRLGETIISLLWLAPGLAWQVTRWPADGPPELAPLHLALAGLWSGSATLLSRLQAWLVSLAVGQPAFDPVAVALGWSLVLWAVTGWAGWAVRRWDRPLPGLLPAGAVLVISMAYGAGNFAFLLVLLGLTWLLLALVGHAARERRWQAAGIDYALDIRTDMTIVTFWLVAVLVTLAQLTPVISAWEVALAAQRLIWGQPLQASPLARSLGLQPQPAQPTAFDRVRLGGLPRRHLLGAGPELSQQVALIVRPGAAEADRTYYWRSLTYDRYTGSGWMTGRTETMAYQAGEPVQPTLAASTTAKILIQQQVQAVGQVGGLLHAAGELVMVDQPYQVAWRSPDDAFGATLAAATYQVVSAVPAVDEAQLRLAGNRYPAWLRQRYLALPDEVPVRVLALARDLTATPPTPYDRARAIEAYLRTFPYDLNLPAPPLDRDVVDYFLFDLQRGYCDYYATAMVVLARAAGIPARLVMGYAGGRFDPDQGRYRVTEADAHAWPELYFPGYGWIEFEPTAARPTLERAAEPVWPAAAGPEVAPPEVTGVRTGANGYSWGLLAGVIGVGLALGGGAAWAMADLWWLGRLPPETAVKRLYRRLQRYGPRLAAPAAAGDTPLEFSAALTARISALARQQPRWAKLLLPAAPEIERLTGLYVGVAYSPRRFTPADRNLALQTWRWLRWRLWLAQLIRFTRLQLVDGVSRFVRPNFRVQWPTK